MFFLEEKLLKILKLADELNEKQDKVYAEINYKADNRKKLEIIIRSKMDFGYIQKCQIQLVDNSLVKWNNIIELFENYVDGCGTNGK